MRILQELFEDSNHDAWKAWHQSRDQVVGLGIHALALADCSPFKRPKGRRQGSKVSDLLAICACLLQFVRQAMAGSSEELDGWMDPIKFQ